MDASGRAQERGTRGQCAQRRGPVGWMVPGGTRLGGQGEEVWQQGKGYKPIPDLSHPGGNEQGPDRENAVRALFFVVGTTGFEPATP